MEEVAIAADGLPNATLVYQLVAYVKKRQGHFDEALTGLKQAYELDPRNEDLAADIASTLNTLRRYPEAEHYLELLLTIAPEKTTTHVFIAMNSWLTGDLERARDAVLSLPDQSQDVAVVVWWAPAALRKKVRGSPRQSELRSPGSL